jgi:hypothetical protein
MSNGRRSMSELHEREEIYLSTFICSFWAPTNWMVFTHIEGRTSLFSPLTPEPVSSENTFTDVPRNNASPVP